MNSNISYRVIYEDDISNHVITDIFRIGFCDDCNILICWYADGRFKVIERELIKKVEQVIKFWNGSMKVVNVPLNEIFSA